MIYKKLQRLNNMNLTKHWGWHPGAPERKEAVFMLIHLPEAQEKSNWIRTSENYERIFLNKYNFFLIWFLDK